MKKFLTKTTGKVVKALALSVVLSAVQKALWKKMQEPDAAKKHSSHGND